MPLRVAVVRPFDERFRKRVMSFLAEFGFDVEGAQTLRPGARDDEARAWMTSLTPAPNAFVIPFHEDTEATGVKVDGLSLLEQLTPEQLTHRLVLMPVSTFALAASFPRRMEEFRKAQPVVAEAVLPLPADAIGSEELRAVIETLLVERGLLAAKVVRASTRPGTPGALTTERAPTRPGNPTQSLGERATTRPGNPVRSK